MTDEPPLLLDYGIATSPNPLEASGTTDSRNHITIAVSAGETVYCDKIHLYVPKYDPEHPDGNPGFTEPPEWSYSSADWEVDSAWLDDETHTPQYFNATFRPKRKKNNLIDYPLNFGITGYLGPATGTLACRLEEHSGTSENPSGFTYKKGSFTMAVDSQTFYLNNFLARDPGKPTVPRTKYSAGDQIYLTWESNGTRFQLYTGDGTALYDSDGKDIKDKNGFRFTLEKGSVTSDTTFTLCATLTAGEAQSQNGFEPIYQYATVTITITNPVLAALTVTGDTQLQSQLTVNGNTRLQNELTVNGVTHLQSQLDVDSFTYVHDQLQVDGYTNLYGGLKATSGGYGTTIVGDHGLTISGNLSVYSASIDNNLTVGKSIEKGGKDVVCYGETFTLGNLRFGPSARRWAYGAYDDTVTVKYWKDIPEDYRPACNWVIDHTS